MLTRDYDMEKIAEVLEIISQNIVRSIINKKLSLIYITAHKRLSLDESSPIRYMGRWKQNHELDQNKFGDP